MPDVYDMVSLTRQAVDILFGNMSKNMLIELGGATVATVVSAVAVVGSVATHMRSKSYEVLIQHRLESLDSIRTGGSKVAGEIKYF